MYAALPNETTFSLPAARLVWAVVTAAGLIGSGWMGATIVLGQPVEVQWAGLIGAGVVLVVSVLGILAMAPWKTRPASMWMTLWLAGTLVRMLAAPALTFLLYSALPLNAMALTLSVAVAYLFVLLTETAVIARHVSKTA
jgi:hypothetical protein